MSELRIAFLGDINGKPGRRVVAEQIENLRRDHAPDLIIANAENARAGSGLNPTLYRKIRNYSIDAVTLGDHVYRDMSIVPTLETRDEPIARPANLSAKAIGRRVTCLQPRQRQRRVFVVTVLGRLFMSLPANDPFATVDEIIAGLGELNPIIIVEAHMEATSEKAALAYYLNGRVTAVIGTHTHVPTTDARLLSKGTAFITDVGMCGPYDSIIGRKPDPVLRHMTTSMHAPYEIGEGGEAMCGVVIRVEEQTGRAVGIERVEYSAT